MKYPGKLLPLVERKWRVLRIISIILKDSIFMVEGYRSPERQDELYAKGRTTPGKIVTYAKAGESMHQYGICVDYAFTKKPNWPSSGTRRWKLINLFAKILGFYSYGLSEGWDDGHIEVLLDYSEKDFPNEKVDYERYN